MFRTIEFAVLAALGLVAIAFLAPQQLPLVLYKATLVFLGGYIGYWADRLLFPYARPDNFLSHRSAYPGDATASLQMFTAMFNAATIRRTVIVAACILGLTLGL